MRRVIQNWAPENRFLITFADILFFVTFRAKDEYRQMTASYDQPGLANPYHSADWYRRRDAPHTSTNLERIRSYPGDIIIID